MELAAVDVKEEEKGGEVVRQGQGASDQVVNVKVAKLEDEVGEKLPRRAIGVKVAGKSVLGLQFGGSTGTGGRGTGMKGAVIFSIESGCCVECV